MFTLFVSLLFSVPTCFRARAALQTEILALRHQVLILQRSGRGHKLRLSSAVVLRSNLYKNVRARSAVLARYIGIYRSSDRTHICYVPTRTTSEVILSLYLPLRRKAES